MPNKDNIDTELKKPKKPRKRYKKPINLQTVGLVTAIVSIMCVLVFQAYKTTMPAEADILYTNFLDRLHAGEVEKADLIKDQDSFKVTFTDGTEANVVAPKHDEFRKEILEAGVEVTVRKSTADDAILSVLATAPMFILTIVIVYFIFKTVNSQSTTLFKVLKGEEVITFNDVAGMSETKEEVAFAVSQLKNAKELEKAGARPCKGIILEGPPGTGKTLLAKAIAGEAGVPFISTSGADFIEMFVGLGAARVRALWNLALTNAPCVVFIDEIDAVGRRRSGGGDGANVESNQTLNALLQRMDGLGVGSGVFVVAATNRIEDLDPALLRPGRFDKHLFIGPPKSKKDRDEIIRVHMKGKEISKDLDFDAASKLMFGLSGAEIAQVMNEAVLISFQKERKGVVELSDIDEAAMKLRAQGVSVSHTSESDRQISAVHESGHAIVSMALGRKISKVSILPYSSGIGGLTIEDTDSKENRKLKTKSELLDDIKVLLAGREAEFIEFGDTSVGCSNDIEKASIISFEIVNSFAMSDDHMINLQAIARTGVAVLELKDTIDRANEILVTCRKEVNEIINSNIDMLHKLKDKLLTDETVIDIDMDILKSEK